MRKLIYILTLFLMIASCGTKKEKKQESTDDTNMFPQADAVFLKLQKEYTLHKDGSVDYREKKKLKLLTHTAFNRLYGETFIVFNPRFQKLLIKESKTIMANGKTVKTPDNAFNDVLPRSAAGFPAANHLLERVVTHTALEVNSTIILEYLLKSAKGFYPAFIGNEIIQQSSPAKEISIKLNVPAGTKLNYKLLNDSSKVKISNSDSVDIYEWNFENVAALHHENNMGSAELPRLIFNNKTFEEQQNILLTNDAYKLNTNDAIDREVENAIKRKRNDYEKLEAIQSLVINNLTLKNVKPEYMGFEVRTAADIWESTVATPMEKAIVLSAMLQQAGFKSQIHLLLPIYINNNEGSLLNIEQALIYLPQIGETSMYISPVANTGENMKYKVDRKNIVVWKKSGEIKSISNMAGNRTNVKGYLKLPEEGNLKAEISGTFTNKMCPYIQLSKDKDYANNLLTTVSKSKITSITPNEVIVDFLVNNREIIKEQQGYYSFELPHNTQGADAVLPHTLISERNNPLALKYSFSEKYKYTIELADYLVAAVQPIELNEEYSFGSIEINIKTKGHKVFITREIKINNKVINVSEYHDFRKLVNYWNLPKYRTMRFRIKGEL